MQLFLIALGILAGFAAIVAGVGSLLPRAHVATRTLRLLRRPAEVWALITDAAAFPSWRSGITHVDPLPDRNGRAAWIEHGSSGDIPLETIEETPPSRLVLRIADDTLPFGGTWTYIVSPTTETSATGAIRPGSTLTITENGWVSNVVFRFASRFVLGHHRTIDTYLKNVAAKFGEKADISGE
jgi:uncharacterized protein YndB with AHSA1/START domain